MTRQTMTMSAVSVLLASLALAGCDKRDDTQAARTSDTAVVQGQPTAGEQAQRGAEQVGRRQQAGRQRRGQRRPRARPTRPRTRCPMR